MDNDCARTRSCARLFLASASSNSKHKRYTHTRMRFVLVRMNSDDDDRTAPRDDHTFFREPKKKMLTLCCYEKMK